MDARSLIPPDPDVDALKAAAAGCRACPLYADATQTVFGVGNPAASVMLVGEQPGDVEDRRGLPFVGPAGLLLQRAMDDAGLAREAVYVTNAVKHFRFTLRGKRRIHATPGREHIEACAPWLEAELAVVDPRLVVCLGGTAMKALLGPKYRVTKDRGALLPFGENRQALITTHPSAILRLPGEQRDDGYQALVADLTVAAGAL